MTESAGSKTVRNPQVEQMCPSCDDHQRRLRRIAWRIEDKRAKGFGASRRDVEELETLRRRWVPCDHLATPSPCSTCGGSGSLGPDWDEYVCPWCQGTGTR